MEGINGVGETEDAEAGVSGGNKATCFPEELAVAFGSVAEGAVLATDICLPGRGFGVLKATGTKP